MTPHLKKTPLPSPGHSLIDAKVGHLFSSVYRFSLLMCITRSPLCRNLSANTVVQDKQNVLTKSLRTNCSSSTDADPGVLAGRSYSSNPSDFPGNCLQLSPPPRALNVRREAHQRTVLSEILSLSHRLLRAMRRRQDVFFKMWPSAPWNSR